MHARSPEVIAFITAYQENRRLATQTKHVIVAIDRRRYIAIDEADSAETEHRTGRFLIDTTDGTVYTIKGYGQRGRRVGTVQDLIEKCQAATATYNDRTKAHRESVTTRIGTWK